MASIKLILRKDKVNKKTGEAPIYLRIIKDRRTKFMSVGIRLNPKYWNENQQKVRKSYKNSARLNAFLSQKVSETENKILDETSKNRNISTKDLKEAIIGKEPPKFFEFAHKRIETMKAKLSLGSYKNYKSYIVKFGKYAKNKNLYFEDITVGYLKDYEYYMRHELNNGDTSAEFSFSIIKLIFNEAIREDFIGYEIYPFRKYNLKKGKSTKTFLKEEDFDKLLNYSPLEDEQVAYDMFLFSCYAGGLRFFDVFELQWEHYIEKEQRFGKIIHKTKRFLQFKLPQQAIDILEKYKTKDDKQTDYVFKLLENDRVYTEVELLKNKHNRSASINRRLDKIGKKLELPFKLTFHIARHTFATLALKLGMRMEYVSKILDHSDIKITQVYAKIINQELDKAMENVFK